MARTTKTTKTATTKESAKKAVAEKALSRKELARKIDKNSELLVMNNTRGEFIYNCPKTHEIIDLGEKGDTQIITVETLLYMKNTVKAVFERYWLLVIDVLDDEFTVEELFAYIGFDKYSDYMLNMEDSLEDLLANRYDNFKSIVESLDKNILSRLVEYAVDKYEKNEFTDHNKMMILEKAVARAGIFENIDIAKEA